ncbi:MULTISPECIES: tyrosine-type recombinase/integrase [Paraburkholderia]|uniref:Integrase family protein n=1 Tax=Paraburkholderia podalyriae TaxID=1938811 RepID=A0ABR7PVD5_9BURK|nr:tyrosine-type recombinase/integrase [Paraburkholderia podalyriae]MBC8750184.1 integrase family protein [Paraburkholderia podalyriae]
MPKENPDEGGRRSTTKVNFGTKSALTAALMKPGRKTDSNPTSLQIRVSPLKKAVWYYRFRDKDGLLREGTLKYAAVAADGDGRVTLDYEQAKAEVARIKGDAAKSESERREESDRTHFDTLEDGFRYYLANRITLKNEPLEKETKTNYEKVFNQYLRKNLLAEEGFKTPPSQWNLADTKVMQWMQLLVRIKGKSLSKARNCQSIISGIYGMGVALRVLDSNPMNNARYLRVLPKPPEKKRHVDTVNLPHLFDAIDAGLSRQSSKDAVTLVMMTGTRLLAGLGLRWDQIDFEGFYFVQPKQPGWKGFTGILPLSDFVLELLKRRFEQRKQSDGDYVFPAHHGKSYPHQSRMHDAMKAVSEEFNFRSCPQDLRRTFATVANLCFDYNTRKVGALLTHRWAVSAEGMVVTQDAITRRYIGEKLSHLRALSNTVTDFMLELARRKPLSERTRSILTQYDPENLKLIDLPASGEELALQRLLPATST